MTLYSNPDHEVIYCILELLPTIDEALQHMTGQLEELRLEESMVLFQDSAQAIVSIANNLVLLMPKKDETGILQSTGRVREAIGAVSEGYKVSNLTLIQTELMDKLLPAFSVWRLKVERLLVPAIMS